MRIKKVAVSPIPEINGAVVDTLNVDNKTTNAPSVRVVEEIKNNTYVPTDAIIAYDGDTIPEGYEEVNLKKGHGYYNDFRTSDLAATSETATGIKVNLNTTGGDLFVFASLPLKMNVASGYVRVYIDGVNKGNIATTSVQSDKIIHSFSKIFTGIEKGSHEVELYILPDPYSANQNPIITIQRYVTQCLTVIEL